MEPDDTCLLLLLALAIGPTKLIGEAKQSNKSADVFNMCSVIFFMPVNQRIQLNQPPAVSLSLSVSHSHQEIVCVTVSATVLYLIKCNQQRVQMSVHTRSEYEYSHFRLESRPCSSSSSKQNRKNDSSLIHFYLRSTVPLPIKILRGLSPRKRAKVCVGE